MGRNSLSLSKIPSDHVLESLYNLRNVKSVQLKTVLELYDMETHQMMTMPSNQKVVNHGEERGALIRNWDFETVTPETKQLKREQR